MKIQSPFVYFGGKNKLAKRIVEMMPKHEMYVEPFFGSGAVLFAKPASKVEVVNDVDGDVVNFFRVLRDRPEELKEQCALSPYSREEYRLAELSDGLDSLERARRFWVRITQSYGQMVNDRTGWSIGYVANRASGTFNRLEMFAPVAERLMNVEIDNRDAFDVLDRVADFEDCVIYVDPPYLGETRTDRDSDSEVEDYHFDMAATADHERLAERLNSVAGTVLLSGYHSELYDELYDGWFVKEFETVTSSTHRSVDRTRTEVVWIRGDLGMVDGMKLF